MTTDNQRQATLGEVLYVFAHKLENIFEDGYDSTSREVAIILADDTNRRTKEGLCLSSAEEYSFHTRMLNLIADYPELKRVDPSPVLRVMEEQVMRHFRAFKENKPDAREEALRFQLAVYRYRAIAESQLFPYYQLKVWWDHIENVVFRKTDSLFPKSFVDQHSVKSGQDEFAAMNQPKLALRKNPKVTDVDAALSALQCLATMGESRLDTLFEFQLIYFDLANGQQAVGLLGEGEYFLVHETATDWEIIDGLHLADPGEYKPLNDRVLYILKRYALVGLVPRDLLENCVWLRQAGSLLNRMDGRLKHHEDILNRLI